MVLQQIPIKGARMVKVGFAVNPQLGGRRRQDKLTHMQNLNILQNHLGNQPGPLSFRWHQVQSLADRRIKLGASHL